MTSPADLQKFGTYARILIDNKTGSIVYAAFDRDGVKGKSYIINANELGALYIQLISAGYTVKKEKADGQIEYIIATSDEKLAEFSKQYRLVKQIEDILASTQLAPLPDDDDRPVWPPPKLPRK